MTATGDPETAEMHALREELRKLRKINAVLMDRVERSTDMAGNAFSMFETAISLEAMVRNRTSELGDALTRLAKANAELAEAHASADAAQLRLHDAIESINEGFALFDAHDQLILCNQAYLSFWPQVADHIEPGITFEDMARIVASSEQPRGAQSSHGRWVSERLARHEFADGSHVQALADGRWVQINELRTTEGGIVGIYTDITDVKASDARARARELAERNLVLQATLDNLSEGVCVFDPGRRLSTWNEALHRLLGLPEGLTGVLDSHEDLLAWCRTRIAMHDAGCLDWRGDRKEESPAVRVCQAGDRTYEVRSSATRDGGQVIGFTDVTDMHRAQASLKETAELLERRVAERTAELTELNLRLEVEVKERRAIEAALVEAKTAAEQANLSKTSFLAAASHDLLQPLNAARLFAAALADRRLALPTRALVNQTSMALDSVEDLLEALLEISRLDAGAIQPEFSDFRIDQLLATLRVEFAPMAQAAGLALAIEVDPVWVRSDVRLLRRILQNFLSNALRYTQRGSVRVASRIIDGQLEISVIDTGPGIPADKHAMIFEEFRRLDAKPAGKGLGLSIVKRASEMLGHPIAITSAPGEGSCFRITVPLGVEVAEADGIDQPHTRDRSMRGVTILVIDNERSIQAGMRTLLSGWGCAVISAGDFVEAVAQFPNGEAPDILLIDYHLDGDETGDAVMARLHAHFGRTIPSVMISADRGEPLKTQLAASAIPLLNKPVKPAQLRSLLRTLV